MYNSIFKTPIFSKVFNIQLFADVTDNINTSSSAGLSAEMKEYYDKYLLDNAEPELYHGQFGQKRSIPKNGGKTIEFRKYDPYPKATKLTEGITPAGRTLSMKTIKANVDQYGDYTAIADVVQTTAIDNNLAEATELHGAQAGRTLDTVNREVLVGGTNVQYADGSVSARSSLVGGKESGNHYLTVDCIKRAVRTLKTANAKKIDGSYVGIVHPDVSYDLTNDPKFEEWHKYAKPEELYNGEIGKIAGVRFVETTEAKIFEGAGADGRDVYATLIIADNAYGTVDISGCGLKHIFHNFGEAGSSDPLDQRATTGWKAMAVAVRLMEPYMVRIETASTFESGAN